MTVLVDPWCQWRMLLYRLFFIIIFLLASLHYFFLLLFHMTFLPSLLRPLLAYPLPLSYSVLKSLWSASDASLQHLIAIFSNTHSWSLLCCPSYFCLGNTTSAKPVCSHSSCMFSFQVTLAQNQVTIRLLWYWYSAYHAGWYHLRVFLHQFLCLQLPFLSLEYNTICGRDHQSALYLCGQ